MAPPSTRSLLSAVLFTHEEQARIGACLASVAFADEILIIDSDGTDEMRALAQRAGARLIEKEWMGFGRQRQFAVDRAMHDWVLCIDADEQVSARLAASIQRALEDPVSPVYRMARRNRFLGRWLAHGEGYPDWSMRLFNRNSARWSDDPVHEKVLFAVTPGKLEGDLLRDPGKDLAAHFAEQNEATSLAAAQMHEAGRRGSLVHLALSPLVRFFKFYVLRLGFLDGVAGLVHITLGCVGSYLKYAKLIELDSAPRQDASR